LKLHNRNFLIQTGYFALVSLLLLLISRVVILFLYFDRVIASSSIPEVLFNGLRVDVSLIATLIALALIIYTLVTQLSSKQSFAENIIRAWYFFWFLLITYFEFITPTFINEFDIRPNRLLLEYLGSPGEVFSMLANGFLLSIIITLTGTITAFVLYRRFRPKLEAPTSEVPKLDSKYRFSRSLIALLHNFVLFLILVFAARSGFQHRPINPAMVAVSSDRLVNSIVLNSLYSTVYALYELKNESDVIKQYGSMPLEQVAMIFNESSHFSIDLAKKYPTEHSDKPFGNTGDYDNLIIVVEESLGAHFVESLGGFPVTPNIESWRKKSWFFDNLHATGIRSARGLEAIVTGFPPTPARAVLKMPKAESEFFTIASFLKNKGYSSTFIYGGESHFDNMKGFFLANGFDEVIDQNDYPAPKFKGSWGVSDEDLFAKSMEYINNHKHRKNFILIFSSSNHPPFEYPDGTIEKFDSNKATALNAAKYADYALGRFLDEFDRSGGFSNSLMLVVADHEDKVRGNEPVPYHQYKIPGFIIGKSIEPRVDSRLASQIDLGPTLLSIMGFEEPHPMIGRDLNKEQFVHDGIMMQFGNNQAYMTEQYIAYLQPQKDVLVECIKAILCDDLPDVRGKIAKDALAHAILTNWLYENKAYR